MESWYVRAKADSETEGPFDREQILARIREGRVGAEMWFAERGGPWEKAPPKLFGAPPPAPPPLPVDAAPPPPLQRRGRANEWIGGPPRSSLPLIFGLLVPFLLLGALTRGDWARVATGEFASFAFVPSEYVFGALQVEVPFEEWEAYASEFGSGSGFSFSQSYAQRARAYRIAGQREGAAAARETRRLGIVLLIAGLLTVLGRITSAILLFRARYMQGRIVFIWHAGTALLAGVLAVALLFQDSAYVHFLLRESASTGGNRGIGVSMIALVVAVLLDVGGSIAMHRRLRGPVVDDEMRARAFE